MSFYQVTTFQWLADWDRDETYGHMLSNISAYVLACQYRMGMDTAFKEVAPPARMTLTLNNAAGAWSVAKTGATFASVFKKGVLVKFSYNYDVLNDSGEVTSSDITDWFIGTITQIQLSSGALGDKTAILTVEDPTLLLQDAEYHPPLLTNVTTDAAIERLFDDGAIAYPYPNNYWLLEVPGASELESTTTLFEHTLTDFDTGQTTLAYSGDQADGGGRGISCLSFIRDMVASEAGGKFYWDARTGKFIFHNRNYVTEWNEATSPFLTAAMVLHDPTPPEYHYADDLINEVELSYQLRKVGSSTEILFTSANVPMSISANSTRTFRARYVDPDAPTARVGGLDMIPPTPGQDYTVNSASDGSGSDQTGSVTASVTFDANSANVNIINPTASTVYVTLFQLRGTKLSSYAQETARQVDGLSIFNNGRYSYAASIPVVESSEFASDYARTILSHFSQPIARYGRITRSMNQRTDDSGGVLPVILGRGVGDVIYYRDDFLDSLGYQTYLVVGEEGTVIPGEVGGVWDATWVLEHATRLTFWALDVTARSELGETTILAL